MLLDLKFSYTAFSVFLVLIDLFFAVCSYKKHTDAGHLLGRAALLAALVAGSYLISVIETNYRAASVMASVYFVSIDWLLITMIKFAAVATTRRPLRRKRPLLKALIVYAAFETILFAVNPFKEIVISYVRRETPIAFYAYDMHFLYYCHLVFTYLMVIAVIGILVRKSIITPKQFRAKYLGLVGAVAVVVAINAFFLIPGSGRSLIDLIDASIPGYSIGILIMYWSVFKYSDINLKLGLSDMVFDTIDQGIVLFDYDGFLVYKNKRAEKMFPEITSEEDIHADDFLAMCDINSRPHSDADRFSVQCFTRADSARQFRCDFTRLRDEYKSQIGELFVLTDSSEETDLLTGFHLWMHFSDYLMDNPDLFKHPVAVAEFDINGLSAINSTSGKDAGDQCIKDLADLLRKHMPEETYYVRGYDAHLIAIAYYTSERQMREYGERIIAESRISIEAGYSSADDYYPDIIALIHEAARSMTIKKLINGNSAHSHTLTSLVRALKESDNDTEAHVRRTQHIARELGARIGLTDLRQSQLSLLCLLHDIGKVGIPLDILNKPGKLSDEEWAVLKTHPEKGYQIAKSSKELTDIAEMILFHHERWDGRGYPNGRAGEDIPLLSRIIAVVDSYDAMVNDRSYRKAMPPEAAQAELRRCSGSQFDPTLTEEFLAMLSEKPELANGEKVGGRAQGSKDTAGMSAAEKHGSVIRTRGSEEATIEAGQKPASSHPVLFSRYIMDLDDRIISADDNFELITGYSREEIRRRGLRQIDLIPEQEHESYFEDVEKQLTGSEMVYMEHDLIRKDGSLIHVLCYARRHYDSASRSIRTEVVIVDSAQTCVFGGKNS